VTADPLAFLHATLQAAQAEAEAANLDALDHEPSNPVEFILAGQDITTTATEAAERHIRRHDPAAVLRRIAADRKLLADLTAETHHEAGDPWYTCMAATNERDACRNPDTNGREQNGGACDCGLDARVKQATQTLAEGWGWTGETT
jgi:hypothetical protein